MSHPQALRPTRLARISTTFVAEPLLGGSRSSCEQRVGGLQPKQKKRLGDIPVRVQ